jgi:hypothetical protein
VIQNGVSETLKLGPVLKKHYYRTPFVVLHFHQDSKCFVFLYVFCIVFEVYRQGKFMFGSYQFNITPILCKLRYNFICFLVNGSSYREIGILHTV